MDTGVGFVSIVELGETITSLEGREKFQTQRKDVII